MSYMGKEAEIATAIYIAGFPPEARARLGDSYRPVLNALVELAREEMRGLSNLVSEAEETGDNQLISDIGELVLEEEPASAYRAGKMANDPVLQIRAEEMLLKMSPREAYNACGCDGYDNNFLGRIIDTAIQLDPQEAIVIAGWHAKEDGGRLYYTLAEKLLPIEPRLAYIVAEETKNKKVKARAREAWVREDHLSAFNYGINGMQDVELARYVVEYSTEGIKGKDLYEFVRRYMPGRVDLLDEARRRYAIEDSDWAYANATDDIDGRRDRQLETLALSSQDLDIWHLIESARKSGSPGLWNRAARVLSEQSGLPAEDVISLFK